MIRKSQVHETSYFLCIISGLTGGIAEIAWIYVYNLNKSNGLKEISYEIAKSLSITSSNYYTGLLIHLGLSILLGIIFGKIIFDKVCKKNIHLIVPGALLLLSCIWVCAFKLLLPILNPDMVNIVPKHISFVSKMLFSVFMVLVYAMHMHYKPNFFHFLHR